MSQTPRVHRYPAAGLDPHRYGGPDPPAGGPCRVEYDVSSWQDGLTAEISVTNTGTSAINGWALAFTLPGGQTITSGWNASYTGAGDPVTARPVAHHATIAASASVGLGFQATHTGNAAEPTSFALDGNACAVA